MLLYFFFSVSKADFNIFDSELRNEYPARAFILPKLNDEKVLKYDRMDPSLSLLCDVKNLNVEES